MSKPRSIGLTVIGIGASLVASRLLTKRPSDFGELSDAVDLGYSPENALPIAGQAGFPAVSDVDPREALRSIVHPNARKNSDTSEGCCNCACVTEVTVLC